MVIVKPVNSCTFAAESGVDYLSRHSLAPHWLDLPLLIFPGPPPPWPSFTFSRMGCENTQPVEIEIFPGYGKTPVDLEPLHFLPLPFTLVWDPEGEMGNQISEGTFFWVGFRSSQHVGGTNWGVDPLIFPSIHFYTAKNWGPESICCSKIFPSTMPKFWAICLLMGNPVLSKH